MKKLIECVPNISEGRDMNIINQVTAEIEKVEGVKLLDVDPVLPPTVRLSPSWASRSLCARLPTWW